MTKSTITRERARQIFLGNGPEPSASEERELARMALAAMESEPVAWRYRTTDIHGNANPHWSFSEEASLLGLYQPLYAAPQPAPVVPAVSYDIGEIRVGRLPTMNQDDYPGLGDWWVQLRIGEDSDEVLARVYGATPQEANNRAEALACRAAMLQTMSLTGNSPVITDEGGYHHRC